MKIALIDNHEIEIIIPLLMSRGFDINPEVLKQRLIEMTQQNYVCAGVWIDGELVGCSGLWIRTNYFIGKHYEPDNVIILPEFRNQGIGAALVKWVSDYAIKQGCVASELNCYLENEDGHRFWRQQGYTVVAYHFQKKL